MSKDRIAARNAYYKGQFAAKRVISGQVKSIEQYVTEALRESSDFSYWTNGVSDEFAATGREAAIGIHQDDKDI